MYANPQQSQRFGFTRLDIDLSPLPPPAPGYQPYPAYTVKAVPSGWHLIRRNDHTVFDNTTYTSSDSLIATSGDRQQPLPVVLRNPDGSVRHIPAGTSMLPYLRDGDHIHFPQSVPSATLRPDTLTPAAKLQTALLLGLEHLPQDLQQAYHTQLQVLKEPQTLALLSGIVATWGLSHAVGVGQAADLTLLGLGYAALGADALVATRELAQFAYTAAQAQTSEDLEQAAQHFRNFAQIVGMEALTTLAGVKAGETLSQLSKALKRNSNFTTLSQDATKLLEAVQEQTAGLSRRLGKVGQELEEWLKIGRQPQPTTPEGLTGPLPARINGRSSGSSLWVDRALKEITTQYGEKIAELVNDSLEILARPDHLGPAGANQVAEKLRALSTQSLPGLKQRLEALQGRIAGLPEDQQKALQKIGLPSKLESSLNAINKHLKPDDLIGALRDQLDLPVKQWRPGQGPKQYDHDKEVSNALNSLFRDGVPLDQDNKSLSGKLLEAKKQVPALQKEVEGLIKHIKGIKDHVQDFRNPATYRSLQSQAQPATLAQLPQPIAQTSSTQLPPKTLLQAQAAVETWRKHKPYLLSDRQAQDLIERYTHQEHHVNDLTRQEQQARQTLAQLERQGQRSLLNPFGVSSQHLESTRQRWLDASDTLYEANRTLSNDRHEVREAQEAIAAYTTWKQQPEATLAQQLKQPEIAAQLLQAQDWQTLFRQNQTAATALNRPPTYQQALAQAQATFLETGNLPAPELLSAMRQDLTLYQQLAQQSIVGELELG